MHAERLRAVLDAAAAAGASAALVSDRDSLRWIGASGARHLLVHDGEAVAIAAPGAPPPPAPARVERIDMSQRDAVAAALARALANAGVAPTDAVAIERAQLGRALVRVVGDESCRDIGDALAGMRARKDRAELDAIARAAELVDAGQAALRARLRAGMTEMQLWHVVHAAIAARAGGVVEARVELTSGAGSALPGTPPGERIVAAGEPVLLTLACAHEGLWARATSTLCAGAASPALTRRHAIVRDALAHGLAAARLGATTGDVDRAMRERLARAGLPCPPRTGFAIGRAPEEAPVLAPGGTTRLALGMTLVLEPATVSAEGAVRIGRTAIVASGGVRQLTGCPTGLS